MVWVDPKRRCKAAHGTKSDVDVTRLNLLEVPPPHPRMACDFFLGQATLQPQRTDRAPESALDILRPNSSSRFLHGKTVPDASTGMPRHVMACYARAPPGFAQTGALTPCGAQSEGSGT